MRQKHQVGVTTKRGPFFGIYDASLGMIASIATVHKKSSIRILGVLRRMSPFLHTTWVFKIDHQVGMLGSMPSPLLIFVVASRKLVCIHSFKIQWLYTAPLVIAMVKNSYMHMHCHPTCDYDTCTHICILQLHMESFIYNCVIFY